jgi:hypothetical protein
MITNPTQPSQAASLAEAKRIAAQLASNPNHGWVCEERHPVPQPATHVFVSKGEFFTAVFGLCTDHGTLDDPDCIDDLAAIAPIG